MQRPICLTLLCFAAQVSAHGSMIMPAGRNSIDAELPAWSDGKHPETGWIEPYNCGCTNGSSTCNNGQSCFWFSQGCTIGCKACDGNGSRIPNFDHCPGESIAPTITDSKYRTVNQAADAGTKDDFTKFNPWRAPGKAPVFDACGMAGGVQMEVFNAGAYNTTKYAKQGDLGSKVLPKRPSGTVWKRGGTATARWQVTATHGGGYQYRLCPLDKFTTDGIANEACFQAMPLQFANPDKHIVAFKDRTMEINATLVPHSVTGTGDWMIHPIPYGDVNCGGCCDYVVPEGEHCKWRCPGCGAPWYAADGACPTDCKRYGLPHGGADSKWLKNQVPGDFHAYSVDDELKVPSDIPAGEYVLGWRWDCEATSQIWSTCADITIV